MNASESTATAETIQNPFPGLRPYEQQEADLFFGRDDQIQDLVERLRRTRFVAVVGSSGCGKSSLVRAGILPMFASGFLGQRATSWRIAVLRPGNNPLANLAEALTQVGINGVQLAEAVDRDLAIQSALATLRGGQQGIVTLCQQADLPADAKLFVLVDQFEELFRFADRNRTEARQFGSQARMFVNLLLEAAQQVEVPIYVMLTMRSEFLADCTSYEGLPEAVNEGLYLVPRLTRDQLRDAIVEPICQAGSSIQNRLVNELLNNLGNDPDQLPILQHALMRLWDQHAGGSDPIDLSHYESIGRVQTALERHLQEIYDEEPGQQATVKALFRELARVTDDGHLIRFPRTLDDLSQATGRPLPELIAVVERFRRHGRSFLTPPPGVPLRGETMIDISHESLIRHWKDLRQWVVEDDAMRRVETWLVEALGKWQEAGRKDDDLLTGERLEQGRSWMQRNPHRKPEKAYVRASLLYRDRAARLRIWGKAAWVIIALMLIAIVSIGFAYSRSMIAAKAEGDKTKAERDKANAERDKANAERERTKAKEGERLAENRLRLTELVGYNVREGVGLLIQNENVRSLVPFAKAVEVAEELGNAESSDQRLRFASVLRQCPRLECAFGPEQSVPASGGLPKRPAIYLAQFVENGRRVATASDDGKIRIWNPANLDSGPREINLKDLGLPADEFWVDAISASGNYAAVHSKRASAVRPDGKPETSTMSWLVSLKEEKKEEKKTNWSLSDILLHRATFTPDETHLVAYGQFGKEGKLNLWRVPPEPQPLATCEFDAEDKKRGLAKEALLEIDEWGHRLYASFFWKDDSAFSREEGTTGFYSWSLQDQTGAGRIPFEARTSLSAESTDSSDPPVRLPTQIQLRTLPSGRLLSCSADGTLFLTSKEGAGWRSRALSSPYSRYRDPWEIDRNPNREPGRPAEIMTTRLSPDGRWLAVSSKDSRVSIRAANADETVPVPFLPNGSEVKVLDFSPDASRLLTAGADGRVKIWNLGAAVTPDTLIDGVVPFPSQTLETPAGMLAFDEEGQLQRRRAIGDKPERARVPKDAYQERWLALSPQATSLMTYNGSRQIGIHDLTTGQTVQRMRCKYAVVAGLFLADGWAACVRDGANRHEFFEVATGRPIVLGQSELPMQLVVSENGQCVAAAQNGVCRVWNVKQAAQIGKEFPTKDSMLKAVSNDGKHAVLARQFPPVAELWRIETDVERIAEFEHADEINGVAFSRDDKYLVTCSNDKSAKVWKLGNNSRVISISCGGSVMWARFSQDSRYVVTSGLGEIQSWDAQTGQPLAGAYRSGIDFSRAIGWCDIGPDVICVLDGHDEQAWTWNALEAIEDQDCVNRMNDLPSTPQNWAKRSTSADLPSQDQWHRRQASICRRFGQWETVVWHLNKCQDDSASTGSIRAQRAKALAQLALIYNDPELWARADRDWDDARQASPWLQARIAADSISLLYSRTFRAYLSGDSSELLNVLKAADKIAAESASWQTLEFRTILATRLLEFAIPADKVDRSSLQIAQEILEQNLCLSPEDVNSQVELASIYDTLAQREQNSAQQKVLWGRCADLLVNVATQDPANVNKTQAALKQLRKLKTFARDGEADLERLAHSLFSNCLQVQESGRADPDECVALYVQFAQVLTPGRDARGVDAAEPLDLAYKELQRILPSGGEADTSIAFALERNAKDSELPTALRRFIFRLAIELRAKSLSIGEERPVRLRQLVDTSLDAADLEANESEAKVRYLFNARKIQEELEREGSFDDDDRRRLARVHVSSGYLERAKPDYPAALREFEAANKLRTEVVATKSGVTAWDVESLADSLEALAQARIANHETAVARKLYHECEDLANHELLTSEDAAQTRAEISIDLGELANFLNDFSGSNKWWLEALRVQEKLVSEYEPDAYASERLAYIKEWLADVLCDDGGTQKAEESGKQGVELRKERLAAAPDRVDRQDSLADGYKWWAFSLDRVGNSQQALVAVDEEIALRRAVFADRSDQASHVNLIDALKNQGDRHFRTRQLAGAKRFYEEALQEAEKCYAAAPDAFRIVPANRKARALEDLASIDRAQPDYPSAAKSSQAAFDIRKQFEESQDTLAAAHLTQADALAMEGRFSKSLEAGAMGTSLRTQLFETDPTNARRRELASALNQLARSQLLMGNLQEADHHYNEALQHLEELAAPGDLLHLLDFELRRRQAAAHASIAHQSQVRGLFTMAKEHHRQAVEIYRQLSLDDSHDADAKASWRDAAGASARLALRLGDRSAAAATAGEALNIARELSQLDAKLNTGYQRSLASNLELMAKVELEHDRPDKSKKYLNEAIDILQPLTMLNPSHQEDTESRNRMITRRSICDLVEMRAKIEEQTDDVKREWAFFQAEKLTGTGNYEQALEELKGLQPANEPVVLFDLARCAARCAWIATRGTDVSALRGGDQQAHNQFCQQSVSWLKEAVDKGFNTPQKFLEEDLDLVRTAPGYAEVAKALEKLP